MQANAQTSAISGRVVDAVRSFNRFYTSRIGVLQNSYLASELPLTEVRVLYELAHRDDPTAADLRKELELDGGYLSRILQRFEERGLLQRSPSETDGRRSHLYLTKRGRSLLASLETRARDGIGQLLEPLSTAQQSRLLEAMNTIQGMLAPERRSAEPYLIRPHQPGDMGWVTHRHGILYSREFGFDIRFEALVAKIVADFIENYKPDRERCWIAERQGEIVGSVFLVRKSDDTAKLRLLLVEPKARGLGIGKRLIEECIRFARQAAYRKITLWTQSHLDAARHLYQQAGFRITSTEPHQSFGCKLVAETWDLELTAPQAAP